jgi:imidazole glycerol-phosphate synthase subunit HisH
MRKRSAILEQTPHLNKARVRENAPVNVAIVDYGSGNLHSARKAFERAAREAELSAAVTLTSDPDVVVRADRIVLPGVGAFADCRLGLDALPGMIAAMTEAVREKSRPFLGICVGMQLLATRGLEHQATLGLGWIEGEVRAIDSQGGRLRIPHMGWNTLRAEAPHPLLTGIPTGEQGLHAYFVHSYAFKPCSQNHIIAAADYGEPIAALIGRENIAGTQFHPEKSQALGLALIANFLRWRP